ncbi:D-hexose-6-phosphate mutarotase [Glaciimonas immobilis]|uniref:Putative glucose-6-phosphate 1-epimerase n=1 Tax=Glaciimonas immobilis TaxID=728004 RepID=A0A840RYN5_9BURK|nr:D-hexose-6-phosphate mutarotase [Glaciimonas immobilis]KAF3997199.1 D-hexose-6-phosphate mutarotase [Glaciimonas immobilis]MBB5202238.1 glucose-6-phosphate 1-epimerase [Glaciimonas immobilis]
MHASQSYPAHAEHPLHADLIALSSSDGAQISVSLHGGHICSWRTADGIERLFLSPLTKWDAPSAIRGGIPVVFPQFAGRGPLPKHGFARTSQWTLIASELRANGEGFVHMTMSDTAETRSQFPFAFKLDLQANFAGASLSTALLVTNTGEQSFDFTCALHTYLAAEVPAAGTPVAGSPAAGSPAAVPSQPAILGLSTCRYENSIPADPLNFDGNGTLHITSEVDSIFFQAPATVELATSNMVMQIQQGGFEDIVVWNPWVAGTEKIGDLMPDAYQHFVCVEAATIEHPVTLAPGVQWRGHQEFLVKPIAHVD